MRFFISSLLALLLTFAPSPVQAQCLTRGLADGLVWICKDDPAPLTGYLVTKTRFDSITQMAELWSLYGDDMRASLEEARLTIALQTEMLEAKNKPPAEGSNALELIGAGAIGLVGGVLLAVIGFVLL